VRQKHILRAMVLLLAALFAPGFEPLLQAQNDPLPTPDQLDQLLAPVALYPDSLLAQITTASTDPQEILDVDNWLQANPDLTGTALTDAAQAQGFDPAFIALVNFPQVIHMMAENVDDYAAIGQAFSADQESVSASVQRLRAQAYASGALQSNSQMQVEVQQPAPNQTVYVIQPASPQVVYVPQYDPTVVYVGPGAGGPAPVIAFGAGIAIGALLVDNRPWGWGGWGWNWGSHRVYYNRTVWGGWGNPYRPPNYWYRSRPVRWASRPGYGGNWRYRPPNYRPPTYYPVNRTGNPQPWGPNNRPTGYRPSRPGNGGGNPPSTRPGNGNRPNPNPGNRPQPRPTTGKPQPKPGTPGSQPQPGTPRPKPGTTRPQPKPTTPGTQPQPKPGTTRPSPRPQPDTSQPKPGTPQPKPTTPRPRPDTSQPKPSTPQPKPSTPRPQPQPRPTPKPQPDRSPAKPSTPKPQPQSKPATQRPQSQAKPARQSKPASKPQQATQPQPQ
jgi:hypothetical protein